MARKIRLSAKDSNFIPYQISVIEYLSRYDCKLYYAYDDIFKYLENNKNDFDGYDYKRGSYKSRFVNHYLENSKKDLRYIFPVKLLIDTFIYQPTKTVFCVFDGTNGIFDISKGTKKLAAYDMLGISYGHILICSKLTFPNQIKTDEELYWLLRKIDPSAQEFDIIIQGVEFYPRIHYIESIDTFGKWSTLTQIEKELLEYTLPSIPAKVKFTGLSYTTDERIISSEENYYCCVYSDKPVDISLDYLYLCSSNVYYKQKVRVGTTLDNSIKIEYSWNTSTGQADFFIPTV